MRSFAILFTAAVLSACGQSADQPAPKIERRVDGTTGTVEILRNGKPIGDLSVTGGTGGWPDKMPVFAPPYPDASVEAARNDGAPGKENSGIHFTTPAKPAAVIAFYQARAKAAGLGTQSLASTSDTASLSASGDGGRSLRVEAEARVGVTHVRLRYDERTTGAR